MSERVYIVGRANVGKSTLCNALLGYGRSIVYDEPGTTRDIVVESADWGKGEFKLCDTQGIFGEEDLDWVSTELVNATVCLFVVDGKSGITPFDREIARVILRRGIPCLLVVNKSDVRDAESWAHFSELGFDQIVETSAAHRKGTDVVKEWVLGQQKQNEESEIQVRSIRLAIIGRPNTGKSTLINRLARGKISKVSPEALTTRDPVIAEVKVKGGIVKIVDTAGVRRPRSKMHAVEELSVKSTTLTVERADVVFLCLASNEGVTDQDRRLLDLLDRKKKPAVILFNFWDLLSREAQRELWENRPHELFKFEMIPISSKSGYNLNRLLPLAVQLMERTSDRVPTSRVNEIIRKIIDRNPPPTRGSQNFNILYTSQVKIRPPTFVFFMNRKEHLPGSYRKYLENEIRREFGYQSQPIQLYFRAKPFGGRR